jgi:transposase
MDTIERASARDLRKALEEVEGKKPALRLVAAIAHKDGVSQTTLARWFGVERKTVYHWLRRLDPDDIAASVTDDDRPGRPTKLSVQQRSTLYETLEAPPSRAGIDGESWTPELVRDHIRAVYDVSYSLPSCRRLMKEAGLRYRSGEQRWVASGE